MHTPPLNGFHATPLLGTDGGSTPARRFFSAGQCAIVIAAGALIGAGLVLDPHNAVIGLMAASVTLYAALLTVKAWLVHTAWRQARARRAADAASSHARRLTDAELPMYTVLVPLFREGNVLAPLIAHLCRMDYPVSRLEILLLCEYDDDDTLDRLRALRIPRPFRIVICPPGAPRTKPRACNIGLAQAKGTRVVIYDAEDRPAVDQLRRAAEAFMTLPWTTACLQARLDYHNHDHNLLTRFFTLEYNFWFDLLLPALVRDDMPIPLGGTSNHFRTQALRELRGWDPYNVTEDADLGLRLYFAGYRTEMLDSVTAEEACARLRPWIRQRSRWMKGYLQTWAVAARSKATWRRGGWRGAVGMHLIIGGTPIVNAINPLFWALNIYYAVTRDHRIVTLFPRPLLYASVAVFLIGNFLFVYTNFLGLVHRERWHLLSALLLTPLYWLLQSIGALRAIGQLVTRPHFWEKTPHGLSGANTDPALKIITPQGFSTERSNEVVPQLVEAPSTAQLEELDHEEVDHPGRHNGGGNRAAAHVAVRRSRIRANNHHGDTQHD